MQNRIFISYSRQDKDLARNLADELTSVGLHPWFDEYNLRPGDTWEDQLKEGLSQSDLVTILIGSGDPSPNVLVEAGMALAQDKKLLVIVQGKDDPKKEILPIFKGMENLNIGFTSDLEDMELVKHVADDISEALENKQLPYSQA